MIMATAAADRTGPSDGEDLVEFPRVTKATPDLNCWIWAAIPPRRGKINITRAAEKFHVSRTTMRRWLSQPGRHRFSYEEIIRAQQLAILRGRGNILWPDLDQPSRDRIDNLLDNAINAARMIQEAPDQIPDEWQKPGNHTLWAHDVLLIWWPFARAWSITTTFSEKTVAKIQGGRHQGEIIQQRSAANKYAADVIKYRTLAHYREQLCITPRALIPYGRTEAIRCVRPMAAPKLQT